MSTVRAGEMLGVHDIGGLEEEFCPLDTREWGYQLWEMQVHAVLVLLTRRALDFSIISN